MRRVTLAARRAQQFLRKPPRPRWVRPAMLGGTVTMGLLIGLGTGLWVNQAGLLIWAGDLLRGQVLGLTVRAGFAVREVYAEGRVRTSQEALRAQLGIAIGEPILAVDTGAVQARLEALPWIERASVARMLPDTIHIHLTERQPLALWQRGGDFVLIDRAGAVIGGAVTPASHRDLRVLVGEQAPHHAARLITSLSTEPDLWNRVVAATWVGDRRWTLHLDNRIEVLLPEHGLPAAWRLLAAKARDDALLERAISVIDLRFLPERVRLRLDPALLEEQRA